MSVPCHVCGKPAVRARKLEECQLLPNIVPKFPKSKLVCGGCALRNQVDTATAADAADAAPPLVAALSSIPVDAAASSSAEAASAPPPPPPPPAVPPMARLASMPGLLDMAVQKVKDSEARAHAAQLARKMKNSAGGVINPNELVSYAIQARVDAVRTALELGANVNTVDKEGMTALMHASIHGRIEIMTLLLERGAKKDLTDADKFTALHYATFKDQRVAALLLMSTAFNSRLANPDMTDKRGFTPLMWACILGKFEMIDILTLPTAQLPQTLRDDLALPSDAFGVAIGVRAAEDDGGDNASTKNGDETRAAGAQREADANARDLDRNTALMHACIHGRVDAVEKLLSDRLSSTKTGKACVLDDAKTGDVYRNTNGLTAVDLVCSAFSVAHSELDGRIPKLAAVDPERAAKIRSMLAVAVAQEHRIKALGAKSRCLVQ